MNNIFQGPAADESFLKSVSGLKQMFQKGDLCLPGALQPLAQRKDFHSFLRALFRHDWVVYAKQPFGGPEHVLYYLERYTHRVAISPITASSVLPRAR